MCAALRRSLVDAVTMSCRTRWARHAYLARHVIQRRSRQELPLFEPRSSTFGTYIHKLRSFPLQFSIECTLSVSHLYSRGSPSRLPVVAWRPRVQLSPPRATYYAWLLGATGLTLVVTSIFQMDGKPPRIIDGEKRQVLQPDIV